MIRLPVREGAVPLQSLGTWKPPFHVSSFNEDENAVPALQIHHVFQPVHTQSSPRQDTQYSFDPSRASHDRFRSPTCIRSYCAITPSNTAPDPISCTCSLFTFLILPSERHAYHPQSLITPLCTLLLRTISAIGKTGSMCPALRQHESVKHANFILIFLTPTPKHPIASIRQEDFMHKYGVVCGDCIKFMHRATRECF